MVTRLAYKSGDEVDEAEACMLKDLNERCICVLGQYILTASTLQEVDSVKWIVLMVDSFLGGDDTRLEHRTDPGDETIRFTFQKVDLFVNVFVNERGQLGAQVQRQLIDKISDFLEVRHVIVLDVPQDADV